MVAATATDDGATVTLPNPNPVDLDEGATTITVTVTAEDGTTTQAYTVTVTRAAAPTTPGVLVSIDDVTVDEGTERDYTVRLTTRPSGDVTVAIAVEAHDDNPTGADSYPYHNDAHLVDIHESELESCADRDDNRRRR